MLLSQLVAASDEVRATRSRRAKIDALAASLRQLAPNEVTVGASYLAGVVRQERLEVGWRTLQDLRVEPAREPTLTVLSVHHALDDLAAAKGPGSRAAKTAILDRLLTAATPREQQFLPALMLGELRQGALEGLLAQAIAAAWEVPESVVRRAWMLSGDVAVVAAAAASGGTAELCEFRLTLFRPLQPMLAQTAPTAGEAVANIGCAIVDYKLDGARIQVHRDGDDVRVFTRNLRDVTTRSPEVVAVARSLPVQSVVLDGEVISLRTDGTPEAFQNTMARFGSDVGDSPPGVALVPFFFDCLHVDGRDLLDDPLTQRLDALRSAVPGDYLVTSTAVQDSAAADDVFRDALAAGQEGVVVKDPRSPYEAGRRGGAWRKVKPTETLDLVVLAVEWGSGRRKGWLSNLHLGARAADGGFVMLGKTFKGMTDQMLQWQTARLLELEIHREGHIVYVRPELVVEIAFDGVQISTRYPGGVALRFARVKTYREDKSAEEADTIDRVRSLGGLAPSV